MIRRQSTAHYDPGIAPKDERGVERDRILPVGQAGWLKERLPQAELHLLPDVGHAPQEEVPELVNKIIIAFLAQSLKNYYEH